MSKRAKIELSKRIIREADAFAEREYVNDAYERDALSKGYYWGRKNAEQDLALTAEDVSCIIHLADQFGKDYQKIADVFNKDREEEQK